MCARTLEVILCILYYLYRSLLLCVFAALERTQTELFDLKTKYDEESTAKYVRVTSYVDHHSYSFINQFIINLAYDKLFHVQLASDYLS